MSVPLIVNGVTFNYPQQFDLNWGPTLTNWSTAVTNGMLQKAGGSFTLTSEVDFGSSFGLKVLSIKSEESNVATTGFLRLANASTGLVWRNALNSANLVLTVNSSNQLTFNGSPIGATTSLTNGHILVGNVSNQPADVAMSGDISIDNTGATAIVSGTIVNADINASAAIALSKLAPTTAYYWCIANVSGVMTPLAVTASRAVVTDANGSPTAASTTATELGYVNGVTSAIQTQIDGKLSLSGGTMAGTLNMASNTVSSVPSASATGQPIVYRQTGGAVSGSTANSGGSQVTVQQGTISTPDLRANAVTQILVNGNDTALSSPTGTLNSITITTVGGPVLLLASISVEWTSTAGGAGAVAFDIANNTTTVTNSYREVNFNGYGASKVYSDNTTLLAVDTPTAGTYTYNLRYKTFSGTLSSVGFRNFIAVELRA